MSLEGLVRDLEEAKKKEQFRWFNMVKQQYDNIVKAKDDEIAALKEEIETLRGWLDHSALPAMNPISKRPEALGLIKLNFGQDKPVPEMWGPGEKELLDSVKIPNEEVETSPLEDIPEAPEPIRDEHESLEPVRPDPERPSEPVDFTFTPMEPIELPEHKDKGKSGNKVKKKR